MNDLQMKTIGEIVDEATKRTVRWSRTFKPDPLNYDYQTLALTLIGNRENSQELVNLMNDLVNLNGQIWDAIDEVTAFEVMVEHTPQELKTMILTAQQVQTFNRQRTDVIRQIDKLCGIESRTPEKAHKHG